MGRSSDADNGQASWPDTGRRGRRPRRRSSPLIAAGVGVLALVGWGTAGASTQAGHARSHSGASTLDILQITALTGSESFEANYAASGYYPSLYALNSAGGILGHQVKITIVDTRSDPADALTSAQQALATSSNVIGVQGPDTTSAPTLVPLFASQKLPMFATAGQSQYDRNTSPYFWRLLPPDPANGEAMAIWAKKQGYTRIAAVFGTDPGSQGDLPGVLDGVRRIHAKLVANIGLTPDQSSYRSDAAQLLAAKPQVIMTETDGPTAATFFSEVQQLGTLPQVMPDGSTANSTYINPVLQAVSASTFNKLFTFVSEGSPPNNPATAALNSALRHVSSHLQKPLSQWENNPFTDAFFDSFVIEGLAATAAKSTNPATINAWITKVTAPGAGKQVVYTYPAGVAALKAGKQIQYVGASGPIDFNKYHNFYGDQAVQKYSQSKGLVTIANIKASQIEKLG